MAALGKELSTKGDRTVKEYGLAVGLKVTTEGVEPGGGCIAVLLEELRPRSREMLQHLTGVILYSSGAFEWDIDDLTWWSAVMKPLHTAAANERIQWTEECQQSVKEMERRMAKMPRAHCDPVTLISDESCLIIMSDASDDDLGCGQ